MKNEIHAYFRDQNVILTHCLFRCKGNASKEDKFRIIYIQMELENLEFDFIQKKIGKKKKSTYIGQAISESLQALVVSGIRKVPQGFGRGGERVGRAYLEPDPELIGRAGRRRRNRVG